jgi:hypothetical protein
MEYRPMEKKLGNYIEKSLRMFVVFSPKVHSDRSENGEGRDNNVMEMISTTKLKEEDKDQQEIRKEIDYMKHYSFPENNIGCLLIFKKLKNVCLSKKKVLGSSFD